MTMGKQSGDCNETISECDKILYCKSNYLLTGFSHTKVCSGSTHLGRRSGYLQIKKKLSQPEHCREKLNRDISIETDICVLRRYAKVKRKKFGKKTKANKSVITNFNTETYFVDMNNNNRFKQTTSLYNEENKSQAKDIRHQNIDIMGLLMDNFKQLLNNWCQKHLLKDICKNSDANGNKIKTEISHSSCSTYTIDENKLSGSLSMSTSRSFIRQQCSYLTVPLRFKNLRVVSTLSIPRFYGIDKRKYSNLSKRRKNLSDLNRARTLYTKCKKGLFNKHGSFNIIAISAKSLTKLCLKVPSRDKSTVCFLKKPVRFHRYDLLKNKLFPQRRRNINKIDTLPSLLRSIYANTTDTSESQSVKSEKVKIDNHTMTENHNSMGSKLEIPICILKEVTQRQIKPILKIPSEKELPKTTSKNKDEKVNKTEATLKVQNSLNKPESGNNHLKQSNQKFIEHATCRIKRNVNIRTTDSIIPFSRKTKSNRHSKNILKKGIKPLNYHDVKFKCFSCILKKSSKNNTRFCSQRTKLQRHINNIFNYFAEYEGKKNIKLDVQITISPMCDTILSTNSVNDNNNNVMSSETRNINPIFEYNVSPAVCNLNKNYEHFTSVQKSDTNESKISDESVNPQFVPKLDSVLNHDQYICTENVPKDDIKVNVEVLEKPKNLKLEITQEIIELRATIKELAVTTEKFIQDYVEDYVHFNRKQSITTPKTTSINNEQKSIIPSDSVNKTNSTCTKINNNPSKAIQITQRLVGSELMLSGIKLKKKPTKLVKNKSPEECRINFGKKSNSFNIIESETLIKVTDMTSTENNKLTERPVISEGLTCSLPITKSLYEMSYSKHKPKLLAFICDGFVKKRDTIDQDFLQNNENGNAKKITTNNNNRDIICNPCVTVTPMQEVAHCPSKHASCSTLIIEVDDKPCTDTEYEVRTRKTLTPMQGMVYCLFCWIPLLIISYIFFSYVIKNKHDVKKSSVRNLEFDPNSKVHYSGINISDLGF